MRSKTGKLIKYITDALFPMRCAVCDRIARGDEGICTMCRDNVIMIRGPVCMKCGKRVKSDRDVFCYDCKRNVRVYDRGFAVFEYNYIKESLFRFKYSGRAEYGRFYAKKTWERYGSVIAAIGIEAFIPVPVHKKRYIKRGYNQAEEYAKWLSKISKIPVESDMVIRDINTIPLKKLRPDQRQKNLKKAFKLKQNDVHFKKVCIVDDIYTTGATINALATLLKEHGVREVYFVTVAIGEGI